MGKVNQLGTVKEVAELCRLDERILPAIDFGHVNSQTLGGLKIYKDYEKVFDTLLKKIGHFRTKNMHIHYSRIEYTSSGEKKHHTFSETEYEPEYLPIAQIVGERGYTPTIICESRGTQAKDAVMLKQIYKECIKG